MLYFINNIKGLVYYPKKYTLKKGVKMAQFRAVIQGQKGQASRLGGKSSGISASVNGWNIGVSIEALHIDGKDVIRVYKTGGSNNSNSVLLNEIKEA